MPRHNPAVSVLTGAIALLAVPSVLFRGRRRRRPHAWGKELETYRRGLMERTAGIDARLGTMAEVVDALRRRDTNVDEALEKLTAAEDELDGAADGLREMLAPEELHPLHMEYEANLERALRGIVTAERGCGITRLPHRPPEDEEPFIYWKRGHLNIVHARMRMQEVVAALVNWEPGRPAEASVASRQPHT